MLNAEARSRSGTANVTCAFFLELQSSLLTPGHRAGGGARDRLVVHPICSARSAAIIAIAARGDGGLPPRFASEVAAHVSTIAVAAASARGLRERGPFRERPVRFALHLSPAQRAARADDLTGADFHQEF